MLAKNLTAESMWQSTILVFWSYCGWLLGQSSVRVETLKTMPPSYQAPRRIHEIAQAEQPLKPVRG
jgi:hypothetical protein